MHTVNEYGDMFPAEFVDRRVYDAKAISHLLKLLQDVLLLGRNSTYRLI
jgi:hypothetical protein